MLLPRARVRGFGLPIVRILVGNQKVRSSVVCSDLGDSLAPESTSTPSTGRPVAKLRWSSPYQYVKLEITWWRCLPLSNLSPICFFSRREFGLWRPSKANAPSQVTTEPSVFEKLYVFHANQSSFSVCVLRKGVQCDLLMTASRGNQEGKQE